jgi:hypothetical protein
MSNKEDNVVTRGRLKSPASPLSLAFDDLTSPDDTRK